MCVCVGLEPNFPFDTEGPQRLPQRADLLRIGIVVDVNTNDVFFSFFPRRDLDGALLPFDADVMQDFPPKHVDLPRLLKDHPFSAQGIVCL